MIFLIGTAGCLGSKTEIIKVSLERLPEETEGFIFINTNEKIKIGVEGKKDAVSEMNLGGQYVLNADELKILVKNTKKLKDIKDATSLEEIQKILKSK
jgi:hypothetical protein